MKHVWMAWYNFCIYESDDGIISLHATRQGARDAVKAHKFKETHPFDEYEKPMRSTKWGVKKINVVSP